MIWKGETIEQYEARAEQGLSTFALFPTQMDDGHWVWLQRYWAGLRRGPNNGRWWVRTLRRADCVYRAPNTPPPPPSKR